MMKYWQIVAVSSGYVDDATEKRHREEVGYQNAQTFPEHERVKAIGRASRLQDKFNEVSAETEGAAWRVTAELIERT